MGSKTQLLDRGLGHIILEGISKSERFVDLFSGSASVVAYAATIGKAKTLAVDLQEYARVLAQAVVGRDKPLEFAHLKNAWFERAFGSYHSDPLTSSAELLDLQLGLEDDALKYAQACRSLCGKSKHGFVKAYGGYYYSASQSLKLHHLRATLPRNLAHRNACLASLVHCASAAAASPGHTAQPFSPNGGAAKFILESWRKDIWTLTRNSLNHICKSYAEVIGEARSGDANIYAKKAKETDLVFLDPPYSGVHYSRFYHVLETLVTNEDFEAAGSGRYPPPSSRPRSDYSVLSQSKDAFTQVIKTLADRGSSIIVTYPQGQTSNGLSGEDVRNICDSHFELTHTLVEGKFSTLGGNGKVRDARAPSREMILQGKPRKATLSAFL